MTRDDIIKAAFTVWGQEFYKTTSLSMLAKSLDVSKAALYRHFPDKQSLLDAMESTYYDSYAGALRPELEKAKAEQNPQERLLIIIRAITKYFAGNFEHLIYSVVSLSKIYRDDRDGPHIDMVSAELEKRGISFRFIEEIFPPDSPETMLLAGLTALTTAGIFLKKRRGVKTAAAEEELRQCALSAAEKVRHGLGFSRELVDAVPFTALEDLVANLKTGEADGPDPLLKSVAEAVAEEGPWNASMETVAKRSGLSKSGLYAHFKSKRDMLTRLFMTEFDRIAENAGLCSAFSQSREERLYLVMLSIVFYLRSRPEILVALDWVRIQRLELDLSVPPQLHGFFDGLNLHSANSENVSQWALFLLVSVLMKQYHTEKNLDLPASKLQCIFRFITLGIEAMW